jgi:hypothetical protein
MAGILVPGAYRGEAVPLAWRIKKELYYIAVAGVMDATFRARACGSITKPNLARLDERGRLRRGR